MTRGTRQRSIRLDDAVWERLKAEAGGRTHQEALLDVFRRLDDQSVTCGVLDHLTPGQKGYLAALAEAESRPVDAIAGDLLGRVLKGMINGMSQSD